MIDCLATSLLQTLPSTCAGARHHHRLLRGVVIECGLHRKNLKGFCRHVELGEPGLKHHGQPQIAVCIGLEVERAGGRTGLEHGNGIVAILAGLRIEFAEEILDKIRIPDVALCVGAHVMRRDGFARQLIFGDDDVGGAAFGPRQRLQFVRPRRTAAQIDGREISGELAHQIVAYVAFGKPGLHTRLRRVVGVLRHALEHGNKRLGVVGRTHDALERVAAHALDQRPLLLGRARHAHEPLGIGELRGEIGRSPKPDGDAG